MADIGTIFEEIIAPAQGGFSRELAQYVLGLQFSDEQVARHQLLSQKIGEGTLTPEERLELEALVHANTIVMILKSKARRSLLQHSPAA